jgi:hypothetical protein
MARETKPIPAALGFRVKSGWAMAVLLAGNADDLRIVKCEPILLSDAKVPQTKQPYHAALELPETEGRAVARRLCKIVAQAARESVKALLKEAAAAGYRVSGAGLIVGSLVDPMTLNNDHMRAHGLEGELFRTVVEEALASENIPYAVLVEKEAYRGAGMLLDRSPEETRSVIANLGKSREGSWRAEEKLAALGAWAMLEAGERAK